MTDNNMINVDDDNTLSAALRAEVPARGADYWSSIDAGLGAGSSTAIERSDEHESFDITSGNDRATAPVTLLTRLRSWPVLAAAAALVLIAGLLVVRLLPNDGETVSVDFADADTVVLEDLPGPTQNVDHWRGVYGVWDCTTNGGAGGWVPAFQSFEDDVGIHSHGDGLISIHPFVEGSAGTNATFSHFADAMNITVTSDAITLDDGRVLEAGTICDGEPAVVHMRRWQSAPELEADPSQPPRVITTDFDAERFYNDLEVWTIALAPLDADIPLPPRDRLDELAIYWFQFEEAAALSPTEDQEDPEPLDDNGDGIATEVVPLDEDAFALVRRVANGSDVDAAISQVLQWTEGQPNNFGEFVPGSGRRWIGISSSTRNVLDLFTYESDDQRDDETIPRSCLIVARLEDEGYYQHRCTEDDQTAVEDLTLLPSALGDNAGIALWKSAPNGVSMTVETDDGWQIHADIVDGISHATWSTEHGSWTQVRILDSNGTVLWSSTNDD